MWKTERKKRITGCNAYSFYTYLNNKNKVSNWDHKVDIHMNNEFKGTSDTHYGLLMEEPALECYKRCTDFNIIELGLLVNPCIPWFRYSPDSIVPDRLIVEIKSPRIERFVTAKEAINEISYIVINDNHGTVTLRRKHMYFCQVQLEMFMTNVKLCHFIVDSIFITEVEYDEKLVKNSYLPDLQHVYFRYILKALITNKTEDDKENY